MKLQVYGTFRPERLSQPEDLGNGVSRNGAYYPATYLNNQFFDWYTAGLTACKDMEIPDERYTGVIVPGVPKLTRFLVGEYESDYVDPILFKESVARVGAKWDISMFADANEAAQWVRENTDLVEVEPGKFLVSEAGVGMMGEEVPARYLTII